MTLNMCGCIDKLCKTELLKDIRKFQCPGASFWFQARGKELVLNQYLVPGLLGRPQTVAD